MNWNDLLLVADEIIDDFGQSIVITKTTTGSYDVETGTVTSTSQIVSAKGVVFDYGERDVNGSTILRGDKRLYVQASSTNSLTTHDTITFGGKEYAIINVKTTNPAGTNLVYDVQVRGNSQ